MTVFPGGTGVGSKFVENALTGRSVATKPCSAFCTKIVSLRLVYVAHTGSNPAGACARAAATMAVAVCRHCSKRARRASRVEGFMGGLFIFWLLFGVKCQRFECGIWNAECGIVFLLRALIDQRGFDFFLVLQE